MQLVGSTCSLCSEKIAYAADATECGTCALGFHIACLKRQNECPKCGSGLATPPRPPDPPAQAQKALRTVSARFGSLLLALFGVVCGLVVAMQVVGLLSALTSLGSARFRDLVLLAFLKLLILGLSVAGFVWARREHARLRAQLPSSPRSSN
jgi:DNA-directed RNA polymerase subunit RPC12/RpoP